MKVPPQAIHHSKCSLANKKQSYYSLSMCCHQGWLQESPVSGPLAKLARRSNLRLRRRAGSCLWSAGGCCTHCGTRRHPTPASWNCVIPQPWPGLDEANSSEKKTAGWPSHFSLEVGETEAPALPHTSDFLAVPPQTRVYCHTNYILKFNYLSSKFNFNPHCTAQEQLMENFSIWSIVQSGIFVTSIFNLGRFHQKLAEIWVLKVGLFGCKTGGVRKFMAVYFRG
jgi:hypothetical protein